MKFIGLLLMVLGISTAFLGHVASAADINYNGRFRGALALSVTKSADMDFGNVSYETLHSGSIRLGTDGNVGLVGETGLFLESSAPTNAGGVVVGGGNNSVIDVSCDVDGRLTAGGGNRLELVNTEIALNAGVSGGSGTLCNGVKNVVMTVDTAVSPVPLILVGGEIDTTADGIDGDLSYSTANSGGQAVTIRVVFQ